MINTNSSVLLATDNSPSNPSYPIERVRMAQEISSGKWYAVKIMKEHQVGSAEKLGCFMNEIRLLSQISHKHVVRIVAVSICGTLVKPKGEKRVVYYVMEHAKYGEIHHLIKETGRFTENQARFFFLQLINGKF